MIIGLHGKMKSGKGEVAALLSGMGYTEVMFARPLKLMVASLLGVPVEQLEDQKYKDTEISWIGHGVTPRLLMQTLGTQWGRAIDENLWVKKALSEAGLNENVVISDVRFPNELYAIQDSGGKVIRLIRPMKRIGPEHEHISETALDHISDAEFDHVIHNVGSLSDLFKKVYDYMDTI